MTGSVPSPGDVFGRPAGRPSVFFDRAAEVGSVGQTRVWSLDRLAGALGVALASVEQLRRDRHEHDLDLNLERYRRAADHLVDVLEVFERGAG